MSGSPPFGKHIPSLPPMYVLQRSTCSPSSNDLQDGPTSPCQTVERGRKKKRTHPLWRKGTEVSPSPSQAWPVEHCTLWCINICLWLKFKQPSVACQTQQKTNIQGKVFTAVVAKGATASKRSHLIGWACVWCYHKAPGHWPLATGVLPPFQ